MITIYEPKAHEIDISELTDFLQSLGEEHRLVFIDINRIVKSECVAVYRDDVVLGVAGVAKNKIGIRQFYVVVKLGYQKKGIGKRLLAEIIDWYKEKKSSSLLVAQIEETNIKSIKLFKNMGFEITGKIRKINYLVLPLGKKGLTYRFLYLKFLMPIITIYKNFF